MSASWSNGSTRQWRKIRRFVLERDSYRCRLNLEGCTHTAGHVHHTIARSIAGDDPIHLVAACQHCNLSLGAPTNNPKPRPQTKW